MFTPNLAIHRLDRLGKSFVVSSCENPKTKLKRQIKSSMFFMCLRLNAISKRQFKKKSYHVAIYCKKTLLKENTRSIVNSHFCKLITLS